MGGRICKVSTSDEASLVVLLHVSIPYSYYFSLFYLIISLIYFTPSPAIGSIAARMSAATVTEMIIRFVLMTPE